MRTHWKYSQSITTRMKEKIIEIQGNRCPICKDKLAIDTPNIVVDHDHDTGYVRGILHQKCNIFLGYIENNVKITLDNVLSYLDDETTIDRNGIFQDELREYFRPAIRKRKVRFITYLQKNGIIKIPQSVLKKLLLSPDTILEVIVRRNE